MQEKHVKSLFFITKIAFFGIGIGFILFLFGLFVNGFNYLLSAVGIGIIVGSIFIILFGMSLSLMEEYSKNSKQNAGLDNRMTVFRKGSPKLNNRVVVFPKKF